MTAGKRYWLYQIPGLAVVTSLSAAGWIWFSLPAWACAGAIAAWILKDVVLYPFLRASYQGPKPSGMAAMVGSVGIAQEDLTPTGFVRIGSELWRAESKTPVAQGQSVQVTGFVGMTIEVRPVAG